MVLLWGSANFLYERSDGHCFRFCEPYGVCWNYSILLYHKNNYRRYVSRCVWLCSNKTLSTTIGGRQDTSSSSKNPNLYYGKLGSHYKEGGSSLCQAEKMSHIHEQEKKDNKQKCIGWSDVLKKNRKRFELIMNKLLIMVTYVQWVQGICWRQFHSSLCIILYC